MGGGITDSVALALNDVAVANPFFAGMLDVFSVLYPQLQDIDFREQATRLEVPVYLTQGPTRPPGGRSPAEEWVEMPDAPTKELVAFESSGHRPLWEEPESSTP